MKAMLACVASCAVVLALVGCKPEQPKEEPKPAPPRVMVVNVKEVLGKTSDGKRIAEEMQKKFASRQATLQSQEETIRRLKADPGLSDPKTGKRDEMLRLTRVVNDGVQQLRSDVAAEEAVLYKPLVDKINKALGDHAKENGLLGIQDAAGYAYIDPSLNITQQIISRVDDMK